MIRGFRGHLALLIVTVGVALGFTVAWFQWSGASPISSGYELKALLPYGASLGSGSGVRIAGVKVGRVTSVTHRGPSAYVEMAIDEDEAQTPLPEDTRAAVRLRTLIGENYIELVPGRSDRTLESGAVLPLRQANTYVEADEILSVLRGRTRQRARRLMQDMGGALDGQGKRLNRLLGGANDVVESADDMTSVLASEHRRVADLVEDVGTVTRAIGERTQSVRELAAGARTTFTSMARRDAGLRSTLQQLPPTLRTLRTTTGLLRSVTDRSAGVLARLGSAVDDLDPVIDDLRPATTEGRAILSRLSSAAPPLETTLRSARRLAPTATTALPRVRRLMCDLNPLVEYLRPYDKEISALFSNIGSTGNFYDETGHALRVYVLAGIGSAGIWSDEMKQAIDILGKAGLLHELKEGGYEPYPLPGDAGKPGTGRGVSGPSTYNRTFPRVQAEC